MSNYIMTHAFNVTVRTEKTGQQNDSQFLIGADQLSLDVIVFKPLLIGHYFDIQYPVV